jgi:hypothetical protein
MKLFDRILRQRNAIKPGDMHQRIPFMREWKIVFAYNDTRAGCGNADVRFTKRISPADPALPLNERFRLRKPAPNW